MVEPTLNNDKRRLLADYSLDVTEVGTKEIAESELTELKNEWVSG